MQKELVLRGRMKYIELNRKFLQEVENGTSWDELQPLLEDMKSLAIYLHYIPATTAALEIQNDTSETAEA